MLDAISKSYECFKPRLLVTVFRKLWCIEEWG